jgi:hypothetical protein
LDDGQYVRVADVSMIYALVAQKSQFRCWAAWTLAGADARAAAPISEAARLRPSAVSGGTTRHAVWVINPYPPPILVAAHERELFFVNNAES